MNNSYNGHLCIVFALEHYNPLGLIRGLGENGICPVYISVKRNYEIAVYSKYISKLHKVDTVGEGYDLLMKEYGEFDLEHKPIVLFSDDKSCGFFDQRYDEWKDKFIAYNAGTAGRVNFYMDKFKIQELAKRNGFNIIESFIIGHDDKIPEQLVYPVITKDLSSTSGNWKSDVYICNDKNQLRDSLVKIASPQILIQRFIDKKCERALQGYSINRGRDVHIVTDLTTQYQIQGYYSPNHYVRPFNDEKMQTQLVSILSEIGYEGIFEVEFIIDNDGTPYFLEINLRASCFNYTGAVAGMPLSFLWAKGMVNKCIDNDDIKQFEPFLSMSEVIDYGKRVDSGLVSFAEWLKDFKEAKCTYLYNKEDIEPFRTLFDNWEKLK